MDFFSCDVLVVGAGPAGLSAARSLALAGADVIVVDERLHPGGQYFKPLAASLSAEISDLDRQFRRLDTVAERVEALNRLHHELEGLAQHSIQKVGVVRFNPFADTGGDQSFAVALLDAEGNGVVLSSLHGRADTRIFAKAVQAGRSKHALSDEEQDAIRKALSPAGA